MNQMMAELKKLIAVPWLEGFILLLPLLLLTCLSINAFITKNSYLIYHPLLWLECLVFTLLFNIALYFLLKDKYDLGSTVLSYGIGFTANCLVPLLIVLSHSTGRNPKSMFLPYAGIFYIIPFTVLFYACVLFLLNKKTDMNKAGLNKTGIGFMIVTVLFLIIVTALLTFEAGDFQPFTVLYLFIFLWSSVGLYISYRAIHYISKNKMIRPGIRTLAWTPLLLFIIEMSSIIILFALVWAFVPIM